MSPLLCPHGHHSVDGALERWRDSSHCSAMVTLYLAVIAVIAAGAAPGDFMAIHTDLNVRSSDSLAPATSVLLSRDGIGDTQCPAVKADILMPTSTLSHKISAPGPGTAAAPLAPCPSSGCPAPGAR